VKRIVHKVEKQKQTLSDSRKKPIFKNYKQHQARPETVAISIAFIRIPPLRIIEPEYL